MQRRYFFKALASGLVAAAAPELFLPRLVKPSWKPLLPAPIVVGFDLRNVSLDPSYYLTLEARLREALEIRARHLAVQIISRG